MLLHMAFPIRTIARTALSGILLTLAGAQVSAMPIGRAWSDAEQMPLMGTVDYLGLPRLDRDAHGVPYFTLEVRWDLTGPYTWASYAWEDSVWRLTARSSVPAAGLPRYVLEQAPQRRIVTLTPADPATMLHSLVVIPVALDSIGQADTTFGTTPQSTEYGAAASSLRTWAIRSEQRAPEFQFHVRVFYSDTAHIWHEVVRLGQDEDHCTVAALGDTTAIVVYAGLSGLQYAILDGSQWVETGNLDPRPFNAAHPRFRIRPSGGLWLFWADNDWMHMSSYRGGVWERGDSLRCVPNPGETFRPTFLDAEHDTTEYPAFAWTNSGYGDTWRDVTAIAFPNGHGWDGGEEVPGSDQSGWLAPTMTHDLNGDLWLIWRRAREGTNLWRHTYCTATCAAPTVTPLGDGARVSWALSSRAPASRWSLWRAEGEGSAFDSLGTVRAGDDSVLALDDPTARPGPLWRYRIRRESVDVRYVWTSETATHQRADLGVPLGLFLANPTDAVLSFRLTGAAGLLWARIYDLQGRLVLRERLAASGTGEDAFTLDLGGSGARRPGIYFLRVSDGTGRQTRTARVAVIR